MNKEEREMDQSTPDQGWQQLQANIERFLGQSLQSDGRRVEYQPRFMVSQPGGGDRSRTEPPLSHLRTPASAVADQRGGVWHETRRK
jgi:hypothetical protein